MIKEELNCTRTFSFQEKLFAQFTYNAGVILATYGLFLISTILAVGYLIFSYMGILLVVRYMVQHALERGYDAVGVCRRQSVPHCCKSRRAPKSRRKDVYPWKMRAFIKYFGKIARFLRLVELDDQVEACKRIFESDTKWTVVRGSDLEEGKSQGLPAWSRHVGDPILRSNLTRRVDFALLSDIYDCF